MRLIRTTARATLLLIGVAFAATAGAGEKDKKKFEVPINAVGGTVKSVDHKKATFTSTTKKGTDRTILGPDKAAAPLPALRMAGSYQFTIEDGNRPGKPVKGMFQKGVPVFFRADNIEFFRAGDMLVYKDMGAWHRSRTGTLSDPLRILGGAAKVRSARLPHEELAQLDKLWTGIKKEMDKGETRLSGDLGKKAAEALAPTESRTVAQGGKAQVWLDGKGRVVRYQITIRLQGQRGNVQVDGTAIRTVRLNSIGTTKVEVPAEVMKLLK